ncbi:hypothetical protein COLO4_34962 [Corchorus olitorius]|uniref:ABC transporter domain-containing protein n=1 Tax=Corchorus olitorius TaxID=93759 RepID=A0A1R3GIP0_9ROSI|nr:hypothetical protein COLO4_34962 [Corchorus olitorius]
MELGHYRTHSNVPSTSTSRRQEEEERDDEEALKWAALERLPTYERARKGVLHGILGDFKEIDLRNLGLQERRQLLNRFIKDADKNEDYLKKLKARIDKVSLNLPLIEVRFENINVEGEAYVGSRALPTILNSIFNNFEAAGNCLHILSSQKKKFPILKDVSGIIKPGRLTLLLGPPGSGKTTLLQALAGKLDSELKHFRLKLNLDMLTELLRREKELNIRPDPYIDALMKASVLEGQKEEIVTDYVLKVTSRKDQKQYWFHEEVPYHFISTNEFATAFKSFHIGLAIREQLAIPYDRSKSHPAALTKTRYGANKRDLMKACLSREVILMKRFSFLHIFKICQLEFCAVIVATVFARARHHHSTVADGTVYLGALYFVLNTVTFSGFFELPLTIDKLPIYYKQRDLLFYPSWAFSLPTSILGIPISIFEVAIWVAITYYAVGFDPNVTRLMSYSLFRCIAALARDHIVANTVGCLSVIWLLIFSGFILSRENMKKWLIWGYWTSPLMYVQTALSVNEFRGEAWNKALNGTKESLGIAVLKARGVFTESYWYWIGVVALVGFAFFFNGISALALAYLDEYGRSHVVFSSEESTTNDSCRTDEAEGDGTLLDKSNSKTMRASRKAVAVRNYQERGMLLPFTPLCVTFDNITYSVDMPKEMKPQGILDDRLLFLLTRGGEEIYFGPIGHHSGQLIKYFEEINGISKIKDGYNPATWVLEVTTRAQEEILGIKFAEEYKKSDLYRRNRALISELSTPPPNSQDLHFPTQYAQSYFKQFISCLWKQNKSYWRNTPYNASRLYFCTAMSIMFGLIFWDLGSKRGTRQDVFNAMGAMYMALTFMGSQSAACVRPVVISERTVYYRERAAGMYSALPYAFAQVAIEIPYTIVQVAIYGVIVYAMMGYEWTVSKFFLNTYFMLVTVLCYIYYGIMIVSVSPNQPTAAALSAVLYTMWSLFSGFIIPRPRIVIWWRWYAWLCPASWSLWGLATSQYGDLQTKLDTGETVAELIQDYFGFRHDCISSLCKDGQIQRAVDLLSEMDSKSLPVGPEMYGEILQGCVYGRDLFTGQQIHAQVLKKGDFFARNEYIETKLVIFYAKCGAFDVANKLFSRLRIKNVFSWAAIIGLKCRIGLNEEALMGFAEMQENGVLPDNFVVPNALKACGALQWTGFGKGVHGYVVKLGFDSCVFVASSLIDMYGKCGVLEDARKVFDGMPERNVIAWNSMIVVYMQNGMNEQAISVFYDMRVEGIEPTQVSISSLLSASANLGAIEEGKQGHALAVLDGLELDSILGSSVINFYSKVGLVEDAELVFDTMNGKDVVTWNLMISTYVQCGLIEKALNMCHTMRSQNLRFDCVTLSSILTAAAKSSNKKLGKEGHCYCIRHNLQADVVVASSIVDMYAKCGRIDCAAQVFSSTTNKDIILWNTLLAAYADIGHSGEALKLFYEMQLESVPPNVTTWNSVILGFIRNHQLNEAIDFFSQMQPLGVQPNLITWTTLFTGLAQNGFQNEAVQFFQKMQESGIKPNTVSITSALSACTNMTSFLHGRAIHGYCIRHEFGSQVSVSTALVDMYAKCGSLSQAKRVFDGIVNKEVPVYNAMISAYALHGQAGEALAVYKHLDEAGIEPDDITFTSVLSACSHTGLVNEGLEIFFDMVSKHHTRPSMEHYGCVVSLLSRSGDLDEAIRFIHTMPYEPDAHIIGSLVAACKEQNEIELVEKLSNYLLEMEPDNSGNYVAISNAYAAAGRWDNASKIRDSMKGKGLKKSPGCSWIEIGEKLHPFLAGDGSHPKNKEIHATLDLLGNDMKFSA